MAGHCWHKDGHSMSFGTSSYGGGSVTHKCCFCGAVMPIMYRNEYTTLVEAGHGDKLREMVRIYTWPDLKCEERK